MSTGEILLRSDFESYLCGGKPPDVELATAPVLDVWKVIIKRLKDGRNFMAIAGEVSGHPKHADGASITTSAVIWLDPMREWCRTRNRVYKLDGAEITFEGFET